MSYISRLAQWLSGRASALLSGGCGFYPNRVIPKTLKMVLAALSLGSQHKKVKLELVSSVSV